MKALSIKSKKESKEISGHHIAIAAAVAILFSIYAVLRLPLRIMGFSTVDKIASFFVVLIPTFFPSLYVTLLIII